MATTLLIDYPEARRVAAHLRATRGVEIAGEWSPVGTRPETLRANSRPLPDTPFVVVNGSGNYHHETYAIVESLCRRTRLAYIHIDAHPDKDTFFRWKIDCASFVGAVLEIPQVEEAVLLGLHFPPGTVDLPGAVLGNDVHYYRCDYFAKLRQYLARQQDLRELHFRYSRADAARARRNPSVQSARVERLAAVHRKQTRGLGIRWRSLREFSPASIASERVYLSVDLDVLRRDIATDWLRKRGQGAFVDNHGVMTLPQLLKMIARISRQHEIVGADLCGLTERFADLERARLDRSLETIAAVYDALVVAVDGGARQPS